MKKLVAATLLSASLCVSQTGGAWASTQTHFPPPVSSERTDVGTQSVPVITVFVAGVLLYFLMEWEEKMKKEWEEGEPKDIYEVCDFYEKYNKELGLKDLIEQLHNAGECLDSPG